MRSKFLYLIALLIAFLLALRIAQIFIGPIPDVDTSQVLLMLQGGYLGPLAMVDNAHPGLLALLVAACSLVPVGAPSLKWAVLLSVGLLAACGLIYRFVRDVGNSRTAAAASVLLYLSSPCISNVAAQSEENILLEAFFAGAMCLIQRYLQRRDRPSLVAVGIGALVLAAYHLQPYLILTAALLAHGTVELFRHARGRDSAWKPALVASGVFGFVGFVYYAIFYTALQHAVTNYATAYFSLFHNDSLPRYARAFFVFAQGYLVTGALPIRWMGSGSVEALGPLFLAGLPVAGLCVWLACRPGWVNKVLLVALGFVFLYEPSSSERWDTVAIPLAIALAVRLAMLVRSGLKSLGAGSLAVIVAAIAMLNIHAVGYQLYMVKDASRRHAALLVELGQPAVIYADLDSARRLAEIVPKSIRLKNPAAGRPPAGSIVFVSGSAPSVGGLEALAPANFYRVVGRGVD